MFPTRTGEGCIPSPVHLPYTSETLQRSLKRLSLIQQTSPYGSKDLFGSCFFRGLSVVLRAHVLMMGKTRQVIMVRSIIPADEKAVVRIEPVTGILLQGIAVILFADPERAAISESHLELEGVVINPWDRDLYHNSARVDQMLAILACSSGSKGFLQEMLQGGKGLAGFFTGALPA